MMIKEPKRHHKVPKCYLQRFSTLRKKRFYVDVYDIEQKSIFNSNTDNVCVEGEFYTFDRMPEGRKKLLEHFYGKKIDDHYDEVYQALTDRSVFRLEPLLRLKVLAFVYAQLNRTSKFVNLEEIQNDTAKENRARIILKNFENFLELNRRRLKDIICVYHFEEGHALITSDNPVFSSGDMFDPETSFGLPLDEKHLLILLPASARQGADNKIIERLNLTGELAEIISFSNNSSQLQGAEKYLIGSGTNIKKAVEQVRLHGASFKDKA